LETTGHQVLHPSWHPIHRVLNQILKPSFNDNKFEESFATWEIEINRYERDSNTILPDNIKIAALRNETHGALQQHLQLTASNPILQGSSSSIVHKNATTQQPVQQR
jgi:hypothetical protein